MNFLLEQTLPIAERHGIEVRVLVEPEPALELRFPNGQVRHLVHSWPDLNPAAAARGARVKAWSLHFLREAGFRIPAFGLFGERGWAGTYAPGLDEEAAIAFARNLGYPVVVKPCTRSYSQGVHIAGSDEEMRAVLPEVIASDPMFLVQRYVRGREYRIVVLDGRIEFSFEKSPARVIGDGSRTLGQLLGEYLERLRAEGHEASITSDDPRFDSFLRATGRARDEIPPAGQEIQVGLTAGLISGGQVAETGGFPADLHDEMIAIARESGLRYAGLDVILAEDGYELIEINAYPGNGGYAALGEGPMARVRDLIERLVLLMAEDGP